MVNLCPVCGYGMEDPPTDYNICPSCGTEFGLHDINTSIDNLRLAWIGTGPRWWSSVDPQPTNWDPTLQLVTGVFGNPATIVFSAAVDPSVTGFLPRSSLRSKRKRTKKRGVLLPVGPLSPYAALLDVNAA
jgi:hypothetical protein